MADRPSGDFGRVLKEARERRGLSLRQIANATKIGVSSLEALERNDFSRLPGGIFSRAFVRSYAMEVGLDPDETFQQFLDQLPRTSNAGHGTLPAAEDHEAVESDRRIATMSVRLGAMALPIAIAIMYFGSVGRPIATVPHETLPQLPEALVATSSNVTEPEVATGTTHAIEVPSDDRLTVGIAALGDCWVAATVDGARVLERLVKQGERETLEVRGELLLTAGDAAALAVTVNGAPIRPLGGAGRVVTLRLNLANFKDYLANP
jgi:cytoskeleton protein RodZ